MHRMMVLLDALDAAEQAVFLLRQIVSAQPNLVLVPTQGGDGEVDPVPEGFKRPNLTVEPGGLGKPLGRVLAGKP